MLVGTSADVQKEVFDIGSSDGISSPNSVSSTTSSSVDGFDLPLTTKLKKAENREDTTDISERTNITSSSPRNVDGLVFMWDGDLMHISLVRHHVKLKAV